MLSDPRRLTRWTIAFVGFWLLGSIGQTISYLWQISLLGGLGGNAATPESVAHAMARIEQAKFAFLLTTLLSHLVFFRWVYVTNRNAQQWSDSMSIRPGWNVAWFLVPVASLWKPFEGIRETRSASIRPEAPDSVPVPTWLWTWWGLWIAAAVYGKVTGVILGAANISSQSVPAIWTHVAGIGINLPLALLTCRLLSDVAMLQSRRIDVSASHPNGSNDRPV